MFPQIGDGALEPLSMDKGSQVQILSARPREPALTSGNAGSEPVRHLTPAELSLLLWSLADCASRGDGRASRGTWRAAAPVRDMTKTARLSCGEAGGGGLSDGGERQAGPKGVPPSGQSGGSPMARIDASVGPAADEYPLPCTSWCSALPYPGSERTCGAEMCAGSHCEARSPRAPAGAGGPGSLELCPSCTGRSWGSAGRAAGTAAVALWRGGTSRDAGCVGGSMRAPPSRGGRDGGAARGVRRP